MIIAGHCLRHNDEIAHNLILWGPKFCRRNQVRQNNSYIDNLNDIYEIRKGGRLQGEVERKFAKSKVK